MPESKNIATKPSICYSVFKRYVDNNSGATSIEYGMIGVFISIAILLGVSLIGADMATLYEQIATAASLD